MKCTRCQAEIAEKAIVCYRCGTPTAIPAPPERPSPVVSASWTSVVVLAIVAVLAGGVAWTSEPGTVRTVMGSVGGLAVLLAIVRVLRRPG